MARTAWLAAWLPLFGAAGETPSSPRVLLDNYYNHQVNQAGKRYHYTWDDPAGGGFSNLGQIFVANGARPDHLTQAPTREALQGCAVYIIVNPNNEKNAASHRPHYMTAETAGVIEDWVQAGGALLLMNNDKDNADFEHINLLTRRFGFSFNEDLRNAAPHHEPEQMRLKTGTVAAHPVFQGVTEVSMRGICTLSVQEPAQAVLTAPRESGAGTDVIMASRVLGRGRVFAVGDPWLYNEYLHTADNHKAAENLVQWLLAGAGPALPGTPLPVAMPAGISRTAGNELFVTFPDGADPRVVGRQVANDLLRRISTARGGSTYSEACTAQGALEFSGLVRDAELRQKLVEAYASTMATKVQQQMTSTGIGVDKHAFGIIPFEIFLQTKDPAYCVFGKTLVDNEWKAPLLENGLTRMSRYWIDDTFMVGMLLTQAYRATQESIYRERLGLFLFLYLEKLQQPGGLFFHGPEYPYFWGRGNGWGAVAMANALTVIAPDDPHHGPVLAGYRKMMAALLAHQDPDGMWHQLIDHPESYEETSCTAMFTYAFILGVKNGWLDQEAYGPAARKGWLGLVRHVDRAGQITDICIGTGQKDDLQFYLNRPRETGNYHGQGPLLWCANALLKP